MYSRLLLNMYTKQNLYVRWQDEFTERFTATNGVKEGRVISLQSYFVYIWIAF